MARPNASKPVKTDKPKRAGKKAVAKAAFALKGKPGTFSYRGLTLRPTFANDERSLRLESAMRAIAMRALVPGE